MAKNTDGISIKKFDDYGITPCDVIFNHVQKPKDYLMCKSINVYDNRWRVNIYSKRTVHNIDSMYISHSYFVSFNKQDNHIAVLS